MNDLQKVLVKQIIGLVSAARLAGLPELAGELDRALLGAILRQRRRASGRCPKTGLPRPAACRPRQA